MLSAETTGAGRLLGALLLAGVLAAGAAEALTVRPTNPPSAVAVTPNPVLPFPVLPTPSYCWIDVRLFDTLRHGPFDFCRRKLRYRPGALECYFVTDQVCATLQPNGQWFEARTPVNTQVFRCPPGPEPPVCRRLDFND